MHCGSQIRLHLVIAALSTTPALADCVDQVSSSENPPKAIMACLRELAQENGKLRDQIALASGLSSRVEALEVANTDLKSQLAELKDKPSVPGSGGAEFPPGAVVAFDLPDGCPKKGWDAFNDANGRVIVGVGVHERSDSLGELKPFELLERGGDRRHRISSDELPPHTHPMKIGVARDLATGDSWGIFIKEPLKGRLPMFTDKAERMTDEQVTASKEFSTLPPYVALYFCKKG